MSRHDQALQRCDRCSQDAKFKVSKGEMELLFCAHHIAEANKNNKLSDAGWDMYTFDEKRELVKL